MNDEMTFPGQDQSFLLHLPQFLGQGRPVQIQIIGKLLAVKGDIEFLTAFLQGYCIQKGHDPSAYAFRGDVETPPGQMQVLMSGNGQQIGSHLTGPPG